MPMARRASVRQSNGKGKNSQPLTLPPPKPPRPRAPSLLLPQRQPAPFAPPPRPIVQCHFQEDDLHGHHDDRLDQQAEIVAGAGPVEDLEDGGGEHDEGDVEGEAGGGAGAVDGEDLVGVGGYGGEDEAGMEGLVWAFGGKGEGGGGRYKIGAKALMAVARMPIVSGGGGELGAKSLRGSIDWYHFREVKS